MLRANRFLNHAAVALLFFATIHASRADAAIVTHETIGSFTAAAGATVTQDFSSVVADSSFDGGFVTVIPFNLISTGTVGLPDRNLIAVTTVDGANPFGANSVQARVVSGTNSIFLSFGAPIYAIGADFNSLNSPSNVEIYVGATLVGGYSEDIGTRFLGFTSDVAFTGLEFRPVASANDTFYFDNVVYSLEAPSPAVPEPSSLALLGGCGLFSLIAARRRKQASAA